jgi:hypothetical protein
MLKKSLRDKLFYYFMALAAVFYLTMATARSREQQEGLPFRVQLGATEQLCAASPKDTVELIKWMHGQGFKKLAHLTWIGINTATQKETRMLTTVWTNGSSLTVAETDTSTGRICVIRTGNNIALFPNAFDELGEPNGDTY